MVVFTCSYCGESVKKNQVEKHYSFKSCYGRSPALTCVDCFKDFMDNDYVAHTSCVTEDERYGQKGFVSKPPSDKGKKKQEMWVSSIKSVLERGNNIEPNVLNLLQFIATDSNIPQKKIKFVNFCKSKCRSIKPHTIEDTWELLEKVKMEQKQVSSNAQNVEHNIHNENEINLDDRKRKRIDSNNESPGSNGNHLVKANSSMTKSCMQEPSDPREIDQNKRIVVAVNNGVAEDNEHKRDSVTEDERYGKKGFVSKPLSDKGKKKQKMWMNCIKSVLERGNNIDSNVSKLLQLIVKDSNIPQKKNKFVSFCRSKCRFIKHNTIEHTWELLEEVKMEQKQVSSNAQDVEHNIHNENEINLDDRKRKRINSNNESPGNSLSNNGNHLVEANSSMTKSKKCKLELPGQKLEENHQYSNSNKLSKKKNKQKRKQEKYEQQLMEVQNEASERLQEEGNEDEFIDEENIKSKKKKQTAKSAQDNTVIPKETKKIKKKHEESFVNENTANSINTEDANDNMPSTFNWEEIIIKALQAKGELPLKRLEKKVVNEFINTKVHVKSVEKVIALFNKKIMKIPKVQVRKEVAKLVS